MMRQQINKKFWMTFLPVFLEALAVVLLILIFLWTKQAAFYTFSNEPLDQTQTDFTDVVVTEDETLKQVAEELEDRELIADGIYLRIRYQFSDYKNYSLCQGTYEISPSMGVDDILDEFTGRTR